MRQKQHLFARTLLYSKFIGVKWEKETLSRECRTVSLYVKISKSTGTVTLHCRCRVQYNTILILNINTVYMKGPKQKGIISLENLKIGLFSGSERKK